MPYDLHEHRHRFAVWAAARAAQRGFASVDVLRNALEATDIALFVRQPESLDTTAEHFDAFHRGWCREIVDHLVQLGVTDVTFGRAAKLVAVYLKTTIVIGADPESRLSSVIHPPIDRYLLQSLASSGIDPSKSPGWREVRWTQLDEGDYYRLIGELRGVLPKGEPFWMLEQYWDVSR